MPVMSLRSAAFGAALSAAAFAATAAAAAEGTSPSDAAASSDPPPPEFGVDISYPMHYPRVSTNYPWLPHNVDPSRNPVPPEYAGMPLQPLGDRQSPYERIIESCRRNNPDRASKCDHNEAMRIRNNLMQPRSMVNYTETGYKKIRTPEPLMELITEFWETSKSLFPEKREPKAPGNIFTNSYDAPSYLLDVSSPTYPGGGLELKQKLWDAARETIQAWTGQKLVPSSLYGIRVYGRGAVLAPHVDRLPLVSSAIINVAQDVDEDWPLEVIAHGGKSVNVTMEPGDFVLYESHSVIHGRPYALKGNFYANIFIHFVPEEEEKKGELPSYIVPGSYMAQQRLAESANPAKRSRAHDAADRGDLTILQLVSLSKNGKADLDAPDDNGWRPLHEAARSGRTDAARFLLDHGADVHSRTGKGRDGMSALHLAVDKFGPDHPVSKLLRERGGRDVGPSRLERDASGRTELHRAADLGDIELVKSLLPLGMAAGDDVDIADGNGWRPLHEAARKGRTEVIRLLLDNGADVNAKTDRGATPLSIARQFLGEWHPAAELLRGRGGIDSGATV